MALDDRDQPVDEGYFESPRRREGGFDASLLRESVGILPARKALTVSPATTVTEAMRAMQEGHCGCVVVTEDGSADSQLIGIFTERDVLFRIVDRGRNPAALPIREVMTSEPEMLSVDARVAHVLNVMSVGGFRNVPIVDADHRPAFVVSVRDVVQYLVDAFPREILNLPSTTAVPAQRAREGA